MLQPCGAFFQSCVDHNMRHCVLSASMATYLFFLLIKIIPQFNFGNSNITFLGRYKNYHNNCVQCMRTVGARNLHSLPTNYRYLFFLTFRFRLLCTVKLNILLCRSPHAVKGKISSFHYINSCS